MAKARKEGKKVTAAASPRKTPTPRAKKRAPAMDADARVSVSPEELQALIREAAYFKAKARNFAPGHEVQDWTEAESEIRQRLSR